ncbi:MAG: hypothetical protein NC548_33970 [Lachnospiraceae bacterium]|nr:hypothetical protein [Lachnospiraceae bacterium]
MKVRDFRFWCQKVLPLVYDDSLSYYEVLCKLKDYFNKLNEQVAQNTEEVESLQNAIQVLDTEISLIKNGDYSFLKKIIQQAIQNVWFGINQIGQFVAYVPKSWSDVTFRTTGYDIILEQYPEFGRIVLLY